MVCTQERSPDQAKPAWLRVRAPSGDRVNALKQLLTQERLHTVCSSAACPNMGECWERGTATFMILGNQCTRACRFCNVQSKMRPGPVDLDEPTRLVDSVQKMGLRHVVITSVARDDLPDGGAMQFARCLELLRSRIPHVSTEVLIPDFLGSVQNLKIVIDQKPSILNHNLETVRRITPRIRSGAQYDRSLKLLENAKILNNTIRTKSGLMLGLGEEDDEVLGALKDLKSHGCDQLTIGQYLRPTPWHHAVHRYVSPEQFHNWRLIAVELGFSHVESAPLVRSSYHAEMGVSAHAL